MMWRSRSGAGTMARIPTRVPSCIARYFARNRTRIAETRDVDGMGAGTAGDDYAHVLGTWRNRYHRISSDVAQLGDAGVLDARQFFRRHLAPRHFGAFPEPALHFSFGESVVLQDVRVLGTEHDPWLTAYPVIIARGVRHGARNHAQQIVGVLGVGVHIK